MNIIPKKHFCMLRHGKIDANVKGYVAGEMDLPLIPEGIEEARLVKMVLNALQHKPKSIVHSGLLRTQQTTTELNADQQLPIFINRAIAERCLGDWSGIPLAVWQERRDAGITPPNGELTENFESRITSGIASILNEIDDPLLVTHYGVIKAFLKQYDYAIDDIGNCFLYELTPKKNKTHLPWEIKHHYLSKEGVLSSRIIEPYILSVSRSTPNSPTLNQYVPII